MRAAIAVTLAAGLVSCDAILGIEDAELDPLRNQTTTTTTTGQGGGGGGDGGALCDDYCATVQENCTGEHQVYAAQETCQGICAALPEGMPGDEIGNTVHCRLTNAEAAGVTGEPGAHCPAAGPGGDGACGDNCESYCVLFESICPPQFEEAFSGVADCQSACEQIPDPGGFDVSIQSGNTVQCRLYHVSAATFDAGLHCPHAAGEPPCVDGGGGSGGTGGAGGN